MKKNKFKTVWQIIFAVILVVLIALNCVAVYWAQALELFLGTVGGGTNQGDTYFTSAYTQDELDAEHVVYTDTVVDEGALLLYNNDKTLPLAAGSSISIFGSASQQWFTNGTGSAAMAINPYASLTLKDSFEDAGFSVNGDLWDYYSENYTARGGGGSGASANWSLTEIPWNDLDSACGSTFGSYSDAAIVVIGRTAGEGADVPRDMEKYGGEAGQHYLELTNDEKELLKEIQAAGFQKTIVIINSGNALELSFLQEQELGVDACFWFGGTGYCGIEEVGALISGEVNPSGHLVDTYLYDNFAVPAMQNFGDNRYVDESGELVGDKYNYVNYAEGIYVGYKYFETRYEDTVMGRENVGDFDYDAVVARPFGYGLSYTDFAWSDYTMTEADGVITVTVTVKNVGDVAGKDVVEVYYQAPYTDYDIQNGVEKASVNLANFAKTQLLEPGASETVTVSFDADEVMKSYDAQQAKAYIMDEGDYFVTAAQDAHQAVNNILQAKGYSVDGDSSMVDTYVVSSFQTFDTDLATGYAVTSRFDDAIADDAVYLSRSNWSIMDNNGLNYSTGTAEGVSTTTDLAGTVGTHVASDELIAQISAVGWEASGIPEDAENNADVVDGAEGDLELIELRGLDFDDPLWEDLLDQVSVNEMYEMMATAGYATAAMDTISKPKCFDSDGPNGISNLVSGYACFGYPIETMLACTWNQELAQHYGEIIGEDCLQANINGWYAPAMNIHRTPFSGRNNEYYSEDATLSGRMATNTVIGANSKGLYTYIKHFALNDQETNRSSICTWAQEQAIREIYLRPFEMAVKEGGSTAIMMSMNRIGFRKTLGHYNLITGTLRGEWGFEGSVITDATNESGEIVDQALAAGTDLQLSTAANRLSDTSSNRIKNALRTATHDVLYTAVNSAAMNGIEKGTELSSTGVPVYMIIMIAIDAIVMIGVVLGEIFVLRKAKAIANGTANTEAVYQRADGKLMSCDYVAIASMVVAVLGLILEFTRIALVVGIALAVVGLIGAIVAKQQSKQYGKVKLVQNALTVCILAVVIAVAGGIGFWIYDVIMVRYFG